MMLFFVTSKEKSSHLFSDSLCLRDYRVINDSRLHDIYQVNDRECSFVSFVLEVFDGDPLASLFKLLVSPADDFTFNNWGSIRVELKVDISLCCIYQKT